MKPSLQLIALSAFLSFLLGCAKSAGGPAADSDVAYYTCTMHPSVRSQDPHGKCPICGMDLVPVKKSAADAEVSTGSAAESTTEQPHEFTIPLDRQQLIGVTYATVERRPLSRSLRAVGQVAPVAEKHWDYVSRVDGYVHDLKVYAPGQRVRKGQELLDIYSPDLVATEQEYLDLLKMRARARQGGDGSLVESAAHLIEGARARLAQWNVSPDEVAALEKTGSAGPYLPLDSPFDAVVEEIPVHQGRHVAVGDHLVDLVDLSTVWVWADFYEDELPGLRVGTSVTIASPADPSLSLPGRIALLNPFIDEQTRTGKVRIDVPNPGERLKPGAYVNVTLRIESGEGLVVPFGAVLPTGSHNIVFVDKGAGRLEPRFVKLRGKFGDDYAVQSGLAEGERVVASGNFLVDAESKVQGALKDW